MAKITDTMIGQIIQAIGGRNNIANCGHCMTRLRLGLTDNQYADHDAIKRIAGVLGVIVSDNQFQIVLGPGKAQTACEMMSDMLANTADNGPDSSELKDVAAAKKQELKQKQTSVAHRFLAKFATIFTPLIPGFIAAGLLLGVATLLEQTYMLEGQQTGSMMAEVISYMKLFSKGLFSFLSILIGYNAQKAFGGSGVNGAILASLFVMGYDPQATSGVYSGISDFFGHQIDPRGNIIGVLIACILGASVERQVRRFIPDSLDMILTSCITLLFMGVITFLLIMPIGVQLYNGMSWLFINLNGNPIGTAILAGLFLLSVMFGIHQGFVPVYFALMDAQGFNSLFPILALAGAGQVGAALALYSRAGKDSLLRTQVKGTIIPGILGVGEPLIYGVTLPRVKPFITACLGGALGGFFVGLVAYMGLPVGLNTVFGPSGIVALPLMTSAQGIFPGMMVYAAGLAIAYFGGYLFTLMFGCKDVDLS
ncbi:PTS N-acetylmuramic acid transporter subunit IIBC [Aeromonas bestiarum]|uniref:PTS N-acetylmuramic acid transporter subunit IIBC n=1 Tax=Aeromonas bestiarum TaxID=105751 RepID=UPI00259D8860|nr:PTS N-acetylmuramic acid transporter subunit IIBC [Aeromonas bestiarum]MDM5090826.1 PTS N-acetylmuramic acid transporter subunit IIBC [Aeromonas bestiarum]